MASARSASTRRIRCSWSSRASVVSRRRATLAGVGASVHTLAAANGKWSVEHWREHAVGPGLQLKAPPLDGAREGEHPRAVQGPGGNLKAPPAASVAPDRQDPDGLIRTIPKPSPKSGLPPQGEIPRFHPIPKPFGYSMGSNWGISPSDGGRDFRGGFGI